MNKNKKTIIFSVLFFIIGIFAIRSIYVKLDNKKYDVNFPQYGAEMNLDVKNLKSENLLNTPVNNVSIYEIEKTADIEKDKQKVVKFFGFSKDSYIEEDGEEIRITDGNRELTIYKNTGGFYYYNSSLMNSETKIDINKVDTNKLYEKCEQVLRAFDIKDVSRRELVPNNITKTDENNEAIDYSLLHLTFNRILDNKKVYGLDKIMFDLDCNGDIASAMVTIKNYKKVGEKSVISAQEAFNKFKNKPNGTLNTDDTKAKEAIINESELLYWIEDYRQDTQITKPVYSMKGKTLNGGTTHGKNVKDDVYLIAEAIG